MKRPSWPLVLAVALCALSPDAIAAEEGHGGPSGWLLALQVVNVIVLIAILVRFARTPIQNFMVQRRHQIQTAIQDAQSRLDSAETELARWRGRLDEVEAEAEEILRGAEAQAEIERARAYERAEATAERLREEAHLVADQEIARARLQLQNEAAELSTSLAGDMVRRSLTPDDDRRLVSEAVERIGAPDGSGGSAGNGSTH